MSDSFEHKLRTAGIEIMPSVKRLEDGHVRMSAEIRIGKKRHELWYRLPAAYEGFLTDLSDPFLLAALFPAMQQARDIHYWFCNQCFQKIV